MKTIVSCVFILMCGILFIGTGTTKQQPLPVTPSEGDINIQIGEYPEPLDINGRYKYHVVINDNIIGMTNQDAADMIEKYKIKPRGKKEFHQLDTGRYGIWAQHVVPSDPSKPVSNNIVNR